MGRPRSSPFVKLTESKARTELARGVREGTGPHGVSSPRQAEISSVKSPIPATDAPIRLRTSDDMFDSNFHSFSNPRIAGRSDAGQNFQKTPAAAIRLWILSGSAKRSR